MPKKKTAPAAATQLPTSARPVKARKGDGVRTDQQREAYPFGRTRMLQLVAGDARQKQILDYITGHHRNDRHGVLWRLLEAGFQALFGTTPPPAPTDCGTRRTKTAKSPDDAPSHPPPT